MDNPGREPRDDDEDPCVMCSRLPMPVALRDTRTRPAYQALRFEVLRAMARQQPLAILRTPGFDPQAMPLTNVVRQMVEHDGHDILSRLLWIAGRAMSSLDVDMRHAALSLVDDIAHHHAITHREDLATDGAEDQA